MRLARTRIFAVVLAGLAGFTAPTFFAGHDYNGGGKQGSQNTQYGETIYR
jgi:multisubunit Na+/H+ antiporter MnhB subunit